MSQEYIRMKQVEASLLYYYAGVGCAHENLSIRAARYLQAADMLATADEREALARSELHFHPAGERQ